MKYCDLNFYKLKDLKIRTNFNGLGEDGTPSGEIKPASKDTGNPE